jgi:hypothetical protein
MSKLAENAIKLNDKFTKLKNVLSPAVLAARERQKDFENSPLPPYNPIVMDSDKALIKAGEILVI